MLYYFKEGKNATETQKKICAVYGEGVWLIKCVKSGLQSFVFEISRWMTLHGSVDQRELIVIK